MPSCSVRHIVVPGAVSVCYPNTDKLDPKIHGRSQIQRKEFERVDGFINNHLCNCMQVRGDTAQNLKAESALPQEWQKMCIVTGLQG